MNYYKKYLFIIVVILIESVTSFANDVNVKNMQSSNDNKYSASFVENLGQVDGEKNGSPDVKFTFQQKYSTVYFLSDRVVFINMVPSSERKEVKQIRTDLAFLETSSSCNVTGDKQNTTTFNYYSKNQNITGARSFGNVVYHNIYPNIDIVFKSQSGKLKYDVVVHPGGVLSNVKYTYENAKSMHLNNGNIEIQSSKNKLVESMPLSYSTSSYSRNADIRNVDAHYTLHDNTIGYSVGEYNKSQDLVIDPTLEWSTYIGAFNQAQTFNDVVNSADYDAEGNLYVVGYTTSPSFPTVNNNYYYYLRADAFIMKYSPTGDLLWSSVFHGEGDENALSVDVDPTSNNIFFCGYTTSTQYFPIYNAVQPNNSGGQDGFISSVDLLGNIRWSTYWGGEGTDVLNDIYSNGVVSVVGTTSSSTFYQPMSSWAFDPDLNGNNDAFTVLLTTSGLHLYSTYLGGVSPNNNLMASGNEEGNGIISTIENGNYVLYIVGTTDNQIYTNSNQTTFVNNYDGFVMRVDVNLGGLQSTVNWATLIGDANNDYINDICFGEGGLITVVGSSNSTSLTDPAWSSLIFNTNHKNQYSTLSLTGNCSGVTVSTNPWYDTYDVLAISFTQNGVPDLGGGMYGDIWDEYGNDIKYGRNGYYIGGSSLRTIWYKYPTDNNYWGITGNPFMDHFRYLHHSTLGPWQDPCLYNIPVVRQLSDNNNDAFIMKIDRAMLKTYWITPYKGVETDTGRQLGLEVDGGDEGFGIALYTGSTVPKISLVGSTQSETLPMINTNTFMTWGTSDTTGYSFVLPDGYIATFADESKFPSFFGGDTGNEIVEDIAKDNEGNYYIVGATTSYTIDSTFDFGNGPIIVPLTYTGFQSYMPTKKLLQINSDYFFRLFPYPLRLNAKLAIEGDTLGFIIKFDANGNRIFSAFIGYDDNSYWGTRPPTILHPTCVTVDKDNNPIIGGYATDSSGLTYRHNYDTDTFLPGRINSYQKNVNGRIDGFLLKLNSQGERLGATYYGGPSTGGCITVPRCDGDDYITDVTTDGEGNIYACGFTNSLVGIASPNGAYRELNRQNSPLVGFEAGRYDGFVVKMNPALTVRNWGTYLGGLKDDYLYGIMVDNQNNVAVTGGTESGWQSIEYPFVNSGTVVNEPSPSIAPLPQTSDVALTQLDATGNVVWSKVFGAPILGLNPVNQSNDVGVAIVQNSFNGSYIVTGVTNSADFMDTDANLRSDNLNNTDAILVRFEQSDGQRLQTRWFGRDGNETGNDIVSMGEDVYITGSTTQQTALPGTLKGSGNVNNQQSAFVARFSNTCQVKDHRIIGGTGADAGTGICAGWFLGYEGTPVQICGWTTSPTLGTGYDVDAFAFQKYNRGFKDGFSASFSFGLDGLRKQVAEQPSAITTDKVRTEVSIFPNPATSNIVVNVIGMKGLVDVKITDITGRLYYYNNIDVKFLTTIDVKNLTVGSYTLTISSPEYGSVSNVFIKE